MPHHLIRKEDKYSLRLIIPILLPQYGADRTGILPTAAGDYLCIAQYPYSGPGEFYLEYGDFNVESTAPADHIVVMGGELLNPQKYYSQKWFEYPYPVAVNGLSNVGGMEYLPCHCGFLSQKCRGLWGSSNGNHEFGPQLVSDDVGSNERLHGWMDEGFNTFITDCPGEDL
ncbi:hypothetical protein FQR65_LT17568 [Abscondita terminalis]|nr:hypothetical protein FQR65_LT17568 [Abscondita terminalis]